MRAGPGTRWTGDGRTGESARRKPAAARFTAAAHRTPTWAATRRAATAAASTLPARRKAAHVGTRPTGPLPEPAHSRYSRWRPPLTAPCPMPFALDFNFKGRGAVLVLGRPPFGGDRKGVV